MQEDVFEEPADEEEVGRRPLSTGSCRSVAPAARSCVARAGLSDRGHARWDIAHRHTLPTCSLLPPQAEFPQDEDAMAEDRVEILDGEQGAQQQGDRPRITTRYMTKYEKARVLGTRALQIR